MPADRTTVLWMDITKNRNYFRTDTSWLVFITETACVYDAVWSEFELYPIFIWLKWMKEGCSKASPWRCFSRCFDSNVNTAEQAVAAWSSVRMFPQLVSDPCICKCQQICFSLFCEINVSTKDIRTAYWCEILGSFDGDYETVALLGFRCPGRT